jgi:DNA polymerase-3 subunit gamma/tau
MLSKSSFNALLKTLEEPPPHVMFLMATTEVEKVPKTVLSRCLQLNLKIIPETQIRDHIQSLLELENIQFDEESLALIAASAQGSIRDGLTLLDQAIAHGNGALNSDQVKALLGTIDQSYIIELIKHVAASDGDGAYVALNKITELNVEYEQVLKIIISVFHNISLHQQLQNSKDASIRLLAESIDPQVIQLHYEIALNALSKFHIHPHPKQALELCILRMLAFQPLSDGAAPKIEKKNSKIAEDLAIEQQSTLAAEKTIKEEIQSKETPVEVQTIEEAVTEESSIPSELDMQSWNSIFNDLNLSMFVSQVFSEFEFVSFADNTLTLKKSDELINPTEGLKTEFLEAISNQLGQKISLIIESGEVIASPAAIEIENAQNQLNQDKDALLENATVKDILDSFGGKIIDESIKKVSQ